MPSRTIVLPLGFGLSAVLFLSAGGEEPSAAKRSPVRVYTNDDLDRVRPFRDETGVRSVPAVSAGERRASATKADEDRRHSRGESYWREEARRVRSRVADLGAQADELRARIAAEEDERRHFTRSSRGQRSRASLSSGPDPSAAARLAAIEKRVRALEDDLAERARRDGALPGWLR